LRDQPGGAAIDTVVLACTHFPLIERELGTAFGAGVRFIDGSDGIARRIAFLTQGQQFARTAPDLALFTQADEAVDALRPRSPRKGWSASGKPDPAGAFCRIDPKCNPFDHTNRKSHLARLCRGE
jgi:glutamate racemase